MTFCKEIGIVLEIIPNSNGVKTSKVGGCKKIIDRTPALLLLPSLFLVCDGRRRGDLNDLLKVIVNQIFKILFI